MCGGVGIGHGMTEAEQILAEDRLIEYCYDHSLTPRALFHERHINRLLELAGSPKKAAHEWCSYGAPIIHPLVYEARTNQQRKKMEWADWPKTKHKREEPKSIPWQEFGF